MDGGKSFLAICRAWDIVGGDVTRLAMPVVLVAVTVGLSKLISQRWMMLIDDPEKWIFWFGGGRGGISTYPTRVV